MLVWTLGTALALPFPIQAMLTAFSAAVIGVLLFWLYRRLRYNAWPAAEAGVVVAALAVNAIVVAAVIADHNAIPAAVACAALIPAIRRLESVGDVQAEMSFGLVLPLLFLARPTTSLLIPILAAFGAFSDPTARSDRRAFVAMFLVAIMPSLLIVVGMIGLLGGTEAARISREVYVTAFRPELLGAAEARAFLVPATIAILPFTATAGPPPPQGPAATALERACRPCSAGWPPRRRRRLFLADHARNPCPRLPGQFRVLAVGRPPDALFRRVSAGLLVLAAAMSWILSRRLAR